MTSGKLSVLMAVFKETPDQIRAAVESILSQSYGDFTFVIVLDNPDGQEQEQVLADYAARDPRIVFFANSVNVGLAQSLNAAAASVQTDFLARIDADDEALPKRFERQVALLDCEPNIALVGSWMQKIDASGLLLGELRNLCDPDCIRQYCLISIPAFHPTWMMRTGWFKRIGGYRSFPAAQDYDFLLRLIDAGGQVTNIPASLVRYRINYSGTSRAKSLVQFKARDFAIELHRRRVRGTEENFSLEALQLALATGPLERRLHEFAEGRYNRYLRIKNSHAHIIVALPHLFLALVSSKYLTRDVVLQLRKKLIASSCMRRFPSLRGDQAGT